MGTRISNWLYKGVLIPVSKTGVSPVFFFIDRLYGRGKQHIK